MSSQAAQDTHFGQFSPHPEGMRSLSQGKVYDDLGMDRHMCMCVHMHAQCSLGNPQ